MSSIEELALSSASLRRVLIKRYYPISAHEQGIELDVHERSFLTASLHEMVKANYLAIHGEAVVNAELPQAFINSDILKVICEVTTEQFSPFLNPQLQKALQLCDVVRVFETSKTQYAIDTHAITSFDATGTEEAKSPELYNFSSMIKKYTCKLLFSYHDIRNNELDLLVKYYENLILRGQQTIHEAILRAVVRSRANYRSIIATESRSDTLNHVIKEFGATVDKNFMPLNLSPEFCLAPFSLKIFYQKFVDDQATVDRSHMHFLSNFEDKLVALYDNSLISITREFFGRTNNTEAYFLTKNSIILEVKENNFLPRFNVELDDNKNLVISAEMNLGVHIPDNNNIIKVVHNLD